MSTEVISPSSSTFSLPSDFQSSRPNNGYENVPPFFVTVNEALLKEKPEEKTEAEYVTWLECLVNRRDPLPQEAAAKGCLEFLKQVHSSGRKMSVYHLFLFAARKGYRNIMDWVEDTYYPIDEHTGVHSCGAAAAGGQLDIVKYLYSRGFFVYIADHTNIVHNGHLDVVKWMMEQKDEALHLLDNYTHQKHMVKKSSLDVLEYFLDEYKGKLRQEWIDWGARCQEIEALEFLAKRGMYPSKECLDQLFNRSLRKKYWEGKLGEWYRENEIEGKAVEIVHYYVDMCIK